MGQHRIIASNHLAPVHEIAVNPFSSYNSNNVNMLTRIVTGSKDRDVIVDNLDAFGIPANETELSNLLLDDAFDTLDTEWSLSNFTHRPVGDIIAEHADHLSEFCEMRRSDISFERFSWYRVEFQLTNVRLQFNYSTSTWEDTEDVGTPARINISLGGTVYSIDNPVQKNDGEYYTVYVYAQENNSDFRLSLQFEQFNSFMSNYCLIDNVKIYEIIRRQGRIKAITDITVDPNKISANNLRPHKQLEITPGTAIKDEAVISMIGTNSNPDVLMTLEYGDSNSWIKNNPYTSADFSETKDFMYNGTDLYDDGQPAHLYDYNKGSDVKWAYLVLYYNYYKNTTPNASYIGIVRPEELEKKYTGSDFMIIAKLRYVRPDAVDAIFYYPERQDLRKIDAIHVTYLMLNNLQHWDNNRPLNVSQALDALAARIYDEKGVLFFSSPEQFDNWKNPSTVSGDKGVGHGPVDYWKWRHGLDKDKDYDKLAFIVQTNEWYRSYVIENNPPTVGVFDIGWEKVTDDRYHLNWSKINNGNWPTSRPSDWKWYSVPLNQHPAFSENPSSKDVGDAYDSSNLLEEYHTLDEAKSAWPYNYYVVESTGPGSVTIINPFDMYGKGEVPGPKTQDVKLNKFLRADNTWQNVPPGTIVLNDYEEFKLWFNAVNGSYVSIDTDSTNNNVVKPGRVPSTDFDRLMYVIVDSSWWRTPTDASISWSADWTDPNPSKENVPNEIKPLTNNFEINWSVINNNQWPTTIPSTWQWVGTGSNSNFEDVKKSFPHSFYRVVNPNSTSNDYRIVNPFNSVGSGLVPGPTSDEVTSNKFLRSDGTWKSAGAIDLHFEVKGFLTPTDNLVQGMAGHDGVLSGVHIWSDTPIDQPAGSGLKVDILLTKESTPNNFVTKSIFTDSTYSGGCWSDTHPEYSTGSEMPELHS